MSTPKRLLESATLAGDQLISTPIGDIELRHNYFEDDASRRLFDEMDYQRACQAYIWSTPLVSITAWRDADTSSYGVTGETDFVVFDSLTGSPRWPERGISPFCGSTGRPSRR